MIELSYLLRQKLLLVFEYLKLLVVKFLVGYSEINENDIYELKRNILAK